MEKVAAIIVAGGSGKRMGMAIKKQFINLEGKAVLAHTIEAFNNCEVIDEIIVVVGKEDKEQVKEKIVSYYGYHKVTKIIEGGKERQDSVYNGLMATSENIKYVMIHDGARPFVTREVLESALNHTKSKKATVVAVPVKDTIKVVDEKYQVQTTPNRSTLWSVQTPQSFEKDLLIKAYTYAKQKQLEVTDDSMLVEAYGHKVHVVEGDYNNIKITTPEDLIIGEAIIKRKGLLKG